jgi:hypothetical protein
MMRFRLRTLLIWASIAPLLIALAYWAAEFALGGRLRWQLYLAYVVVSIYACLSAWRGLNQMLFGPNAVQSWRQQSRRRVKFRIERYLGEST